MKKNSIVVSVTMVFILVLALSTVALAADPHVGTWKLNVAKFQSNLGPAPKSTTLKITAQHNGIKSVSDSVNADGQASHVEFTAKYDDKDYPYTGSQTVDTIALKQIDANTFDVVAKKAGKEIARGREVFSKDGKTMTHTIKGKTAQGQDIDIVTVYNKQ
jgi:hypothetical protein